jgi:hypothetical protein
MWSTWWLNDMGPCPWFATPDRRRDGIPAQLVPITFGPRFGAILDQGGLPEVPVGGPLNLSSTAPRSLSFV